MFFRYWYSNAVSAFHPFSIFLKEKWAHPKLVAVLQNIYLSPFMKYLRASYLFRWFFGRPVAIVDPVENYIQTRYNQFLNFISNCASPNQNIDTIIYDKTHLFEVLADPNNHLEQIWKKRLLIEYTPRGNIYMYYDIFKQGFAYYSDQSGIPYRILNAVATKYVRVFYCLDFFLDLGPNSVSPLTAVFIEEDPTTEKKNQSIPTKDAPFAKFKNYSKSKSPSAAVTVIKKTTFLGRIWTWVRSWWLPSTAVLVPSQQVTLSPPPMKKEKVINKFINLGHSKNFQPLIIPKLERPTSVGFSSKYDAMFSHVQKISYKDYKSMVL
jgi:hypothetical protein